MSLVFKTLNTSHIFIKNDTTKIQREKESGAYQLSFGGGPKTQSKLEDPFLNVLK